MTTYGWCHTRGCVTMQIHLGATLRQPANPQNKESGAPVQPRIKLVAGGEVVAIQFGNAIALCSLGGSAFCSQLTFV